MVAQPIGCGVDAHDEDCLCDIKMPTKKVTVNFDPVREGWFGFEIASMMGLSAPWTRDKAVDFLCKWAEMHDKVTESLADEKLAKRRSYYTPKNPTFMVTPLMKDEIRSLTEQGVEPAVIRRRMLDVHGVTITPTYLSHLRRRLRQSADGDGKEAS